MGYPRDLCKFTPLNHSLLSSCREQTFVDSPVQVSVRSFSQTNLSSLSFWASVLTLSRRWTHLAPLAHTDAHIGQTSGAFFVSIESRFSQMWVVKSWWFLKFELKNSLQSEKGKTVEWRKDFDLKVLSSFNWIKGFRTLSPKNKYWVFQIDTEYRKWELILQYCLTHY